MQPISKIVYRNLIGGGLVACALAYVPSADVHAQDADRVCKGLMDQFMIARRTVGLFQAQLGMGANLSGPERIEVASLIAAHVAGQQANVALMAGHKCPLPMTAVSANPYPEQSRKCAGEIIRRLGKFPPPKIEIEEINDCVFK